MIQMKRVVICALKKNRKQLLEDLQRRGVVEISDTGLEDDIFHKSNLSDFRAIFTKNVADARRALEILNSAVPQDQSMLSALEGKKALTVREYEEFAKRHDDTLRAADRLEELEKEMAENRAEIVRTDLEREALSPWLGLDIPLDFKGTHKTAALIGTLPGSLTQEELAEKIAQAAPQAGPFSAEIVSTEQDQTCLFLFCEKKDREAYAAALNFLGFARPAVQADKPPAQQAEVLKAAAEKCRQTIEQDQSEIKSYAKYRDDLELLEDYDAMRSDKYKMIGHLSQSKRTFLLAGYVPAKKAAGLEAALTGKFDLAIEFSDPKEKDDVPVLLKNNAFATPTEDVLESFSLPARGEIDPTALMAPFYYFLYGMMLGDAAYGIIIALVTFILMKKYPRMKPSMHRMMNMFFYCGLSTAFWGVMFGSYFGDVVDVVGKTFFNVNVTIPALWFTPINQPMRLLVFCLLVGIIHLFAGLGAGLYQAIHNRRYKDALYDIVLWYMLVGGLIVLLLSTSMMRDMFSLTFVISPVAAKAATIVACVGAVGIILTGGRDSRNPVKRIMKGLYSLYNVTGYLSDVLSYSRLLALGLATGVIASVVNKMGSMAGGGVVGAIAFILIFIVGHTLNIAINMLGAYVHTNRLQYVEFFGKFYSGGGRKFHPFSASAHTKYYQFKEENES
ncbi:MAG: V-type ATP synthase subunit I [Oscillospiraceae bacterium]|nr:V-type ATP synthase subunit I [Oscillospiraceae bacterium]